MLFGIKFQLLVTLSFLLCHRCHGDPTLLLNAPMGAPGIGGGFYGMGGHFMFDRDDVDLLLGHPGMSPMIPHAPVARSPTIVVVDGSPAGNTVINNALPESPIPGVRYVLPRRRSSRRYSSPYYRRRRFGYYG